MKHVTQKMSLGFCSLVLVVLLAACGGGTPSTNNNTPAAASTPTAQAPTPTPTPPPAAALTTYTGKSFSIGYPGTWKATGSGDTVVFQDSTTSGNAMNILAVPDPNGALGSADKLADTTVQTLVTASVKNSQVVNVAPTITINGVTWSQRSVTGTATVAGQDVAIKFVVLVTTHPANAANTQAYEMIYGGPTATFDQLNTLAFQPMLQSFKFIG